MDLANGMAGDWMLGNLIRFVAPRREADPSLRSG
jgi:hypothetical protein